MVKKILDIGAGFHPHPKATHAVDVNRPDKYRKTKKLEAYYEGSILKAPKKMKGTFDGIVSRHSVGATVKGKTAGKKLSYITKAGATAEITVAKTNLPQTKATLQAGGFKITQIKVWWVTNPDKTKTPFVTVKARRSS